LNVENLCCNQINGSLHTDGFEGVPEELTANLSGQIEPVRPVPKSLDEYSSEEIENFPKLWDYPDEYAIK